MMYDNDASRRYRKEAEAKVTEFLQRTIATDQERTEHELRIYQVELEMQNLELRETQHRLQQSLDHISCLYHQSPVGFVTIDKKGRILDLNESFAAMLGTPPQDAQRRFLAEFCTSDSAGILRQRLPALFNKPEDKIVNLSLKQATRTTLEVELQARKLPDGEHLACTMLDRTQRKKAEDALLEKTVELEKANVALEQMATVFIHAREGVVITDPEGTILDVNRAFCRITGYERGEVIGRNTRLLKSGEHGPGFYAAMWHSLIENGHWSGEIFNRKKDGSIVPVVLNLSAVRDSDGATRHYVALHTDISALKEHQKQLELLAHYDPLTGLPNRKLFDDRLQQAIAHCKRHGQYLAVAYVDLDGFKAINDNFGHAAGDHLLKTIAATMKKSLRASDTIARFGGDEFVVILDDLDDTLSSTPYIKRLLAAAAQPVDFQGQSLQVSSSIGVAFFSCSDTLAADQLLRRADQSMYRAKLSGKNRWHLYDAGLDRALSDHHEYLAEIDQGLKNQEFVLYYQPKVNMRTGEVVGVEALIRWQHPQRGLLLPSLFLSSIEHEPLGVILGEWVIDTALRQIDTWQQQGHPLPVSVNITSYHFQQPDFVTRLEKLLATHPEVAPSSLSFEILETAELSNMAEVADTIGICSKMGIDVALDDFGTGYSSLTYLRRLPAQTLKIDQSFIHDMADNSEDQALLQGIIALAAAFRRNVIAEGVETAVQGNMLLDLVCDLAQGTAIAAPMPAKDIPAWLANWQPMSSWYQRPPSSDSSKH